MKGMFRFRSALRVPPRDKLVQPFPYISDAIAATDRRNGICDVSGFLPSGVSGRAPCVRVAVRHPLRASESRHAKLFVCQKALAGYKCAFNEPVPIQASVRSSVWRYRRKQARPLRRRKKGKYQPMSRLRDRPCLRDCTSDDVPASKRNVERYRRTRNFPSLCRVPRRKRSQAQARAFTLRHLP